MRFSAAVGSSVLEAVTEAGRDGEVKVRIAGCVGVEADRVGATRV